MSTVHLSKTQHCLNCSNVLKYSKGSGTDLQFRLFARCWYGNQLWDFFLSLSGGIWLLNVRCLVLLCLLFGCSSLKLSRLFYTLFQQNHTQNIWVRTCSHLFLGSLSVFLCLLRHAEVAQVRGEDGQGHWRLTLYMDELHHWSFLFLNNNANKKLKWL